MDKFLTQEEANYEVEIVLNRILYEKKVISEDLYKKVEEKLMKLKKICRSKCIQNE